MISEEILLPVREVEVVDESASRRDHFLSLFATSSIPLMVLLGGSSDHRILRVEEALVIITILPGLVVATILPGLVVATASTIAFPWGHHMLQLAAVVISDGV